MNTAYRTLLYPGSLGSKRLSVKRSNISVPLITGKLWNDGDLLRILAMTCPAPPLTAIIARPSLDFGTICHTDTLGIILETEKNFALLSETDTGANFIAPVCDY